MDLNTNWIVAFVLLPCLAGIFKKEIADIWYAWCIYKDRPFDLDRNPKTADICKMLNSSTGDWGLVIIHEYSFWHLQSAKRGVTFSHVTESGLLERHVGLIEWGQIPKAKIEKEIRREDLNLLNKFVLGNANA